MWSNNYIGIPFKEKGRDRRGADCWGLVRLIYKEQYNIDLPSFANEYPSVDDRERIHELIAQYKEAWNPVDTPSDGSVVLFRMLGSETHIGVAINEQEFIHVREGADSVIERFDSVNWKNRLIGHFKYTTERTALLNAVPHPLQTQRFTVPVPTGTTLDKLADWIVKEWNIAPELKAKVTILVNGEVIPEERWATTILKDTDAIDYRAVPTGSAGRLILAIAIAVVAPYVAASLMTGTLVTTAAGLAATGLVGTIGFTAVTIGVSLLGSALVNAIFPVRPPAEPKDPGNSERQLMMTGGANQANPYGAIPLVLGKVKMTPPLGASNFVTFTNERDSYLSMLLAWGYGPLVIDQSTFKIGDIAYTDFQFGKFSDGSDMLITLDRRNDQQATIEKFNTIYGRDVFQVQKNIELICDGNPESNTSSYSGTSDFDSDANLTSVTIRFNNAVAGQAIEATINSPTPISQWQIAATDMTVSEIITIDSNTVKYIATASNSSARIYAYYPGGYTTASYSAYAYSNVTAGIWQEAATTGKCSSVTVALHFPQGLRKIKTKGDGAGDSYPAPVAVNMEYKIGGGPWTAWQNITIGADSYKKDAFTVNYTKTFDTEITSGVQVRVRRASGDNTEDNPDWRYYHTVVFLTAAFINNDSPAVDPKNCTIAKTALRLKASEQFNGQIQGINAIVQTYCLSYNGSGNAWSYKETNNPADLFRYVLQHPANPQRITDNEVSEKINLAQLQYWWNYCNQSRSYTDATTGITTTYKLTYNSVIAEARSVLDILRDICAAGRASPAMIDGKWTVVIDEPRTSVVQHFTPHNSWGFEGTRALPKLPDALKVTYFDEDQDYQQVETIVYKAGKSFSTAELFESITLPGVTKREMVIDHARWHMAQAQLRRESYVLNTDIEYLVCNRGDRVKVTHDVPMWGLGSGRIKNRLSTKVFDLDEPVAIDDATNYTVRVRSSNGASVERTLQKSFTIVAAQRLANIVTITTNEQHPVVVGNTISVSSSISAINGTFKVTAITATTISYEMIATNIGYQSTGGTVNLTDDFYSRIMVTTATSSTEVVAGDLFLFGLYQQESQDLIVLNIEPAGNKTARLTLVDYGVTSTYNIFNDYKNLTSATVFNTGINLPPQLDRNLYSANQKPTITRITSDEGAADLTSPGTYAYRIRVAYANTVTDLPSTTISVECQYDVATATSSANYKSITVPYLSGNIYIPNVIMDQAYKLRLRYVSSEGATGPWTQWNSTTVVGKSIAPSTPTNFTYNLRETGIRFKWDPSTDVDYSSTIIKYTTATVPANPTDAQKQTLWNGGTKLFEGNADTWTWPQPPSGSYYVMVKHKDTSDNESLVHNAVSINYTDLVLASLQIEFSNPVPVLPYIPNSATPTLTNSGTQIRVLQGGTALKYDGQGTANGRWKIKSVTNGTGITSGSYNANPGDTTNGDEFVTVQDVSAFTATSSATVTYEITGKTTLGTTFTISRVLTYYTVRPSSTASIVYAYKRSATQPEDNPGAVTYSFATASISDPATLANNWSKVITSGTDPLWVTFAGASSNTGSDSIAANEWSTPVKYAENGLNTASVFLYARNDSTTTAPVVGTAGNTTYTFADRSVSGQPSGWSTTIPAESNGKTIWVIQATATGTATTDTIANTEWSTPSIYGSITDNSTIVYVYKRSASEPAATDKPGAVTFSFTTNQITTAEGDMNGWKKAIYAGTDPLWARAATAVRSGVATTDSIAENEWSGPVKYVENGLHTALVRLYARNSSTTSAPTLANTGNSTYTFSTGTISGQPNGWSLVVGPESEGSVIWTIQAVAANTADTDTIPNTEWSTPVVFARKGDPGTASAVVYVYKRSATDPNTANPVDKPTGTITYSFASNTISTAESNAAMNGWKKSAYAGTDPLWVRAATASTSADNISSDTIATTEWSDAIKYVENGLNTASVFLYARNSDTGTAPTLTRTVSGVQIETTYDFTTGAVTSPPTGWTKNIPDASNGTVVWVIQATASNTTSTDIIKGNEWSTPAILAQKGDKGNPGLDGPRTAFGYVYYSVAQGTAPSKPSATDYDFSTGAFTGLTANWSTSINVAAVAENNANQKYWAAKFTVSEASFGGAKTLTFSDPATHLNLSGIVTFTNLTNATDSSGTSATIIDGDAIKTGSIDADRITANQLFVGHTLQEAATNAKFVINFKDKFISISV